MLNFDLYYCTITYVFLLELTVPNAVIIENWFRQIVESDVFILDVQMYKKGEFTVNFKTAGYNLEHFEGNFRQPLWAFSSIALSTVIQNQLQR